MSQPAHRCFIMGCGSLVLSEPLLAGMPSVSLSDAARLGFQGISFFLAGLLVSAAGVWGLWNWLRRDFQSLPRLTYPKACGVVVLWGLLFVLVLTMISGARELMTPGAWEKSGFTYRLSEDEHNAVIPPTDVEPPSSAEMLHERIVSLSALGEKLTAHAQQHEGRFPASIAESPIPPEGWLMPGAMGARYRYVRGATVGSAALVAYEASVFGDSPLAFFADGRIAATKFDVIVSLLPPEGAE